MAGKKSAKALQEEEGLERTDNGMKQTSWPDISMINQKNYYTEYMKRDDQILALRLQNEANRDKMIRTAKDRDRALARTGNTDVPNPIGDDSVLGEDDTALGNPDDIDASKVIVIHPGSQNLRIGFASDALPKSVPMVMASRYPRTESERYEPRPKRQKLIGNADQQFGEEFAKKYNKMSNDLKIDMRANKRKVLPNSKELVVNFNRRTPPEKIPEHNDPVRVEFTDPTTSKYYTGLAAQRIPDDSEPKYSLFWPMQHGRLNEEAYHEKQSLLGDLDHIFWDAIQNELDIRKISQLKQYSCVFVIPDLYDKKYVEDMLELCLKDYGFWRVCFIQESLAASFGAGYSTACIVDVGAQKTSICCVEDGMAVEDSRINLKYGGYDVTETFLKMMLYDNFPYAEINLMRRYDFLLAEELKIKFCTLNQADISVQLYDFHLRVPSEYTRKYNFKTYDEVILAPMGFYDPSIFDNSSKLEGRRKLVDRSYNVYDADNPDDPVSAAQHAILTSIKPSLSQNATVTVANNGEVSTPAKEKTQPFNNLLTRMENDALGNATPGTSAAGSPAPEGANTPIPPSFNFNANGNNQSDSPAPSNMFQFGANGSHSGGTPIPPTNIPTKTARDIAIERDSVLPISPLDTAIITSIQHAAKNDEKKLRDLFGGIMVIGGGAKTPGFGPFLEERLKAKRPDLVDKILVGTSPREMDGQVVVWKGASVFGKLVQTNDTWIGGLEYERLNSRVLHHKVSWNW
ncbi:MAG: actin-like protein arp8 [Claussenomyces sp. TS43310]|nr:MAG: actin-like protein arp8 [Claussenomyces sp. TS43310]